ncbi:MAG: hypothetical protein B7Y51_10845 [Burkholderiales bacterium 28-67-8]|nr:MAG: hypothetical protein B7Y51_10845 [Burkholderiales bacterium 28-67-8]
MTPDTPVPAVPDEGSVYQGLFAAYPDALLLSDPGGHIVLANTVAERLLGYGAGEMAGLSVDALVPDAIRSRHAGYREGYSHNPRARPMGTQMELVARRRDGTEVMVEIALSPLRIAGQPYVVASVRGIEAYPRVRQALQRARYSEFVAQMGRFAVDTRDPQQLLQQVPAVAADALQADACVVFLLEAGRLEFHVAGGVGLVAGEGLGSRLPNRPDTPPGFVLALGQSATVADFRSEQRFSVPASYLEHGLVSAMGVPLVDRGQIIGVLTVRSRQPERFGADERHFLESLSNLLAASLQRSQSEEALAHAQRMESVGQLTGGIAHDFNNLLTIIQGNLQELEDHPSLAGDDAAQPLVAAALRASRRGAELTGKLLAFSRRQQLSPTEVDVGALIDSLADMLRRTLDQRIRIVVNEMPGGLRCAADAGQLESALLNIAINARDAMPEGGTLSFACAACLGLPPDAATVPRDGGRHCPGGHGARARSALLAAQGRGRAGGVGRAARGHRDTCRAGGGARRGRPRSAPGDAAFPAVAGLPCGRICPCRGGAGRAGHRPALRLAADRHRAGRRDARQRTRPPGARQAAPRGGVADVGLLGRNAAGTHRQRRAVGVAAQAVRAR